MNSDLLKHKPSSDLSGYTILVVEDSDDHWFMVRWVLGQIMPTINLVRTVSGHEAMAYLAACTYGNGSLPKLILMDLYLPDREDGWALLEEIKLHHTYRRLPVVILSASSDAEDIEQSYYLRSTSYITKPVAYNEWLACFDHFHRYWQQAVTL